MAAEQTFTAISLMPSIPRPLRAQCPPERIVLTGFMGSGKSTIGPLLAAELGWTFLDLDVEVEQRSGQTVPEIFAKRGEAAFRQEETAALVSILGHPHCVIALGGGAPETLANRLLLEQTPATAVIYLAASFATLAGRCAQQAKVPAATLRPLFADPVSAEMRFAARHPLYLRLAHVSIDTDNLTPAASVAAVLQAISAKRSRA